MRDSEEEEVQLDETIKKAIALGVIAGVTGVSVGPVHPCWDMQLCGIENPEQYHTRERQPVPARMMPMKPTLVSTSTLIASTLLVDMPNYGSGGNHG